MSKANAISNSDAISNVIGSGSGQLGLVYTGMGMKKDDGTANVSSPVQGMVGLGTKCNKDRYREGVVYVA